MREPPSVSAQIRNFIVSSVSKGELKPGDLLPSEMELAKRFDVSKHLVNRIYTQLADEGHLLKVHGKGTFVAEKANELPGSALKNAVFVLLRAETNIGLFPGWFSINETLEGVSAAAMRRGVIAAPAYLEEKDAESFVERMNSQKNILGFIDLAGEFPKLGPKLDAKRIPFVQHQQDRPARRRVWDDHEKAAQEAVEHFLSSGRKRVLSIVTDESSKLNVDALEGCRKAHEARGLAQDSRLRLVAPDALLNSGDLALRLLREGVKFDAVLAYNDFSAQILMKDLQAAGLSIPDDVAVTGSDNMPGTESLPVPLATIDRKRKELGAALFELLFETAETRSFEPKSIVLEDEFLPRRSAG